MQWLKLMKLTCNMETITRLDATNLKALHCKVWVAAQQITVRCSGRSEGTVDSGPVGHTVQPKNIAAKREHCEERATRV